MRWVIVAIISIGFLFSASCRKNQDPIDPNAGNVNCGEFSIEDYPANPGHVFDIQHATMSWDNLLITVGYTGGCATHCFRLIWSGTVPQTDPGDVYLLMTHHNNGDDCGAYTTEDLNFNLLNLKNRVLNENNNIESVILQIEGYFPAQPLIYNF